MLLYQYTYNCCGHFTVNIDGILPRANEHFHNYCFVFVFVFFKGATLSDDSHEARRSVLSVLCYFVVPTFIHCVGATHGLQANLCVFVHLFSFSQHFVVNCFLYVFQILVQC